MIEVSKRLSNVYAQADIRTVHFAILSRLFLQA
jgi:hypothetical protein